VGEGLFLAVGRTSTAKGRGPSAPQFWGFVSIWPMHTSVDA